MHDPHEPERPDPETAENHKRMIRSLLEELVQSERSAQLHCIREARRLGDNDPAHALRACAAHARRVDKELRRFSREAGVTRGRVGRAVGRLFSFARERVLDRFFDEERSYRGTLVGLRHGIDVALMLQHTADASGQVELAGFITRWLDDRRPLVDRVAKEMTWFALHPDVALAHPA